MHEAAGFPLVTHVNAAVFIFSLLPNTQAHILLFLLVKWLLAFLALCVSVLLTDSTKNKQLQLCKNLIWIFEF